LTLGEGDVCGQGLDHSCAALGIQNLTGAAQEVCEGSAVSAITHGSVYALWMANVTFESAACALEWMIHAELNLLAGIGPIAARAAAATSMTQIVR
jgi:hypothetical protein